MGLYETCCNATKNKNKRKHYWIYVEKEGGRDKIRGDFANTIRSHYDRLERIGHEVVIWRVFPSSGAASDLQPQRR